MHEAVASSDSAAGGPAGAEHPQDAVFHVGKPLNVVCCPQESLEICMWTTHAHWRNLGAIGRWEEVFRRKYVGFIRPGPRIARLICRDVTPKSGKRILTPGTVE